MKRLQAYKFQLLPNGAQQRSMTCYAGHARKVWNLSLAEQERRYKAGEKFASEFDMNQWLVEWKKQYPYLAHSPSQTLQQVMKHLAQAYKAFFKGDASHPVMKKKGRCAASFRFPQGFRIEQDNHRIFLPKLGWIRYRCSRKIEGDVKNITVSFSSGHWYASIQTEREVDEPIPQATSAVGIDMGIARLATLSDGSFLEPLNSFRKHEQRLARYQRAMSRKKKFSKNWMKAKARVQKIQARIGNVRRDYLHKATTIISKNHALVVVEDLKIRNMSKSAAGTIEYPGRNVSAKSGLNKAILDQGWFEFRRQLEYKLAWNGGQLIAVPPQYTSQSCPCCGHVSRDNRQTQAKFKCVDCGFAEHADLVGAINIKAAGLAVLACGEAGQSGASVKQEPAEVT